MAPVSLGVFQALSTDLLLSFGSWLSPSILPCLLLLARVLVRCSSADKPPDVIWFFSRSFGDSRSNMAFLRAIGSKEMQSTKEIWYDPLCLLELLLLLLHHPPPRHSVRARPPLKPPFPPFFPFFGFFSCLLFCLTKHVVARRWYNPSIRAWLSRLLVADIFADELPVMRAGNPRIQVVISEQGALPIFFSFQDNGNIVVGRLVYGSVFLHLQNACLSVFHLFRRHHGFCCVIGRLLFASVC
ncbi:hypothetical protein GQ457_16G015100 [Hibiscus cannabinus]